ncbi:MAG TPA: class I SAM-dependent methyltransferase [Bryobacteraceae bacterium]|jgi:O-antigen chain-terminating methyltransferase|nr:class I SAM-dependent methyltransferase [Bryobacteraceae bacterium]
MDPKGEELAAVIAEIRQRVRARYPNGAASGDVALPDMTPLLHARDAAEGKVAGIGSVNPRPPGFANSIAQSVKRLVSRALNWHVREQVEFNRAMLECVQASIDALNDSNRAVATLSARLAAVASADATQQLNDLRTHWSHWRVEWEKKLASVEITFLRSVSDQLNAFQYRVTSMDAGYREQMRAQHANFEAALGRSSEAIQQSVATQIEELQKRFWADFGRIRLEYETIIHAELRAIRQKASFGAPAIAVAPSAEAAFHDIDWLKFAERFRGSEATIQQRQKIYASRFRGHASVLDIGCGRGEMLEVFREAGIHAVGIDLNEDSLAVCRGKGLEVESANLFDYLRELPDCSLGGIVCSQVVEHLPPERMPELVKLAHAKLRTGALLAIETPNPECLAIFATHFYLDPTHRHPIPPALMSFYLEEAGFGRIEVERLSPAIESMPSLAELPEGFRKEFFGALDYAVFARKLG